jgi:hypothetical protein
MVFFRPIFPPNAEKKAILLFPKHANLQGIDGRSQMWGGFSYD